MHPMERAQCERSKLADYHVLQGCHGRIHSFTFSQPYIYVYIYTKAITHNWNGMSVSESEFIMLVKHTK